MCADSCAQYVAGCFQSVCGKGHAKQVDAAYAKECALEGMARTQVMWLKEGGIKA